MKLTEPFKINMFSIFIFLTKNQLQVMPQNGAIFIKEFVVSQKIFVVFRLEKIWK